MIIRSLRRQKQGIRNKTTPLLRGPEIKFNLGNEDFFFSWSQTQPGAILYIKMPSSAGLRVTVTTMFLWIAEVNISILMTKIQSGHPGWKPCKTSWIVMKCRHGMNYTNIKGEKNEHNSQCTVFCTFENLGRNSKTYSHQIIQRKPESWSYFLLLNGVCGMPLQIWKTSSGIFLPVEKLK